ncbi:DotU family type IV/VI secretion system protein [Pseudomonas sp. WS 5412]|uniref:type VI secretion system protein TssL, short form n=1 Tax=Pseudomonas sp. WS 5412 TaxID=2717487 RepID=UPI001475230C|nr:type VI secretion system protein TssL, short form [Pseudomonas sp. WS 5412]NMY30718.1 DotU family type IV/VI secretion system protein [Pseudomonas sp. WS 5412]
MNLTASKKHTVTAQGLDALLQDSYLLVVELRHGASVQESPNLWRRCEKQVEQVQQSLKDAGVSTRSIELISHAQCALLDETALTCAQGDAHAKWASEPLQARFFSRHQAGEFLYEDMRESLRQPSPDVLVLTAFQRVLMLGFQGRYRDANDPEREQLLDELNARVAPLELNQALTTHSVGHRMNPLRWLRSPLVHILAAGLLLVATWWGLDHWLSGLVGALVPGQA